jgi:inner membrane protein
MDSLTQIVLGAACGELTMGKKIGNKAQLIGAISGTIPDLDIFFTSALNDSVGSLEIHRSYSHALPVQIVFALPFAYITFFMFKRQYPLKSFYLLWMLGFTTHAILDSFTTYGTMLFLPFTNYLVGFNNIAVVDPLYTIPFMFILIGCLFMKRDNPKRYVWAKRAVYLSSVYMLLSFGFKLMAHKKFESELVRQNIKYDNLSTSPTMFNSVLWAGMAFTDSTIYTGEYSFFQHNNSIEFAVYPRKLYLQKGFEGRKLNTLLWFSQGKYLFYKSGDTLNIYLAKWGRTSFKASTIREAYIFYHQLYKSKNGIESKVIEPKFTGGELQTWLSILWDRIWS